LREAEDEPLYFLDSSSGDALYSPLKKVRYDKARFYWDNQNFDANSDSDDVVGQEYALRESTIYIFPTPTSDTTFYWTFY